METWLLTLGERTAVALIVPLSTAKKRLHTLLLLCSTPAVLTVLIRRYACRTSCTPPLQTRCRRSLRPTPVLGSQQSKFRLPIEAVATVVDWCTPNTINVDVEGSILHLSYQVLTLLFLLRQQSPRGPSVGKAQ